MDTNHKHTSCIQLKSVKSLSGAKVYTLDFI